MAIKILLVEDELKQLFTQAIGLISGGRYYVESAESGTEAVRKTRAFDPDLIIMDLKLPRQSGLTSIREIRKFNKNVPILATTAYDGKRYNREQAIGAGANDYLPKPFDINVLLAKILELLGGVSEGN